MRIFEADDRSDAPVIVFTELRGNPGTSLTNCIERIAAEVIRAHDFSDRRFPVVIEHYEDGSRGTTEDSHTFDLVTFSDLEILHFRSGSGAVEYATLGDPSWQALDRATVEALVGQKLA